MSTSLDSLMREPAVAAPAPHPATELLSFLLVGGIAALCFVGLSMLMIGLQTGMPDWAVSALCYAALIPPAYLAHYRLSFRSQARHARALPRYVAVQFSALTLASVFSYVFYSVFGMPTALAALLVAGLTAGVNFFVLKLWAFAARG